MTPARPGPPAPLSPSGRPVAFRLDRVLVLLNCRHWFQFTEPKSGTILCPRCNRPREVVRSITFEES